MGKWLYLAISLENVKNILFGIGFSLIVFVIVKFTIEMFIKANFIEDIEQFYEELMETLDKKTWKKVVIGIVILSIASFIPTKKEAIQIMLLNQVNAVNYNLIQEELGKGTEKIIETIEKIKGE